MTKLEVGKKYWIKAEYKKINDFNDFHYWFEIAGALDGLVMLGDVSEVKEVIPERERVTIPKEVAEWIEEHKEQFSTVYTAFRILTKREYGINKWVNKNQDDFARAWLDGYTVEEPLGVLLVDMPENSCWKYMYLYVYVDGEYDILGTDKIGGIIDNVETVKVTEAEAKEKYPNFKWVSLEELGNEQ